jgi:hypothetical protein
MTRLLAFLALLIGLMIVAALGPPEMLLLSLLLSIVFGVFALMIGSRKSNPIKLGWIARLVGRLSHMPQRPPAIQPVTPMLVLAEMIFILAALIFAIQDFVVAPPHFQLSDYEAEWLTSSVYSAAAGLQEYGRIPLWQPYIDSGEPLVENPFSFIFNPFSSLPSLMIGPVMGLRVSVILTTALAGLGGWFLAWTLGLGTLARIALAVLLIGKGNMLINFNGGYYQLAATQAYFPWIVAGVVAMFRARDRRWPYVLTAMAWSLQLYAGNLWHTLPGFLSAAVVALAYLWARPSLRGIMIPRLLGVGLLTFCLSAAQFIPVAVNRHRIGDHIPVQEAGRVVPLDYILGYFTAPSSEADVPIDDPNWEVSGPFTMYDVADQYFSYTAPLWFVLLLFLIPLYRPRWTSIGTAGLICFVLFTLWGAGGQQPWLFLYQNIPGMATWRFVGRALGAATFWMAVLLALRIDSLWQIARQIDWAASGIPARVARGLPVILLVLLPVTTGLAARDTISQWRNPIRSILRPLFPVEECLLWLRQEYPTEHLTVWRQDYNGVTGFLNTRVRFFDIAADFEIIPLPNTLTAADVDLFRPMPRFAIAWNDDERAFLRDNGYQVVWRSPSVPDVDINLPCLYEKRGTLPYAYQISLRQLQDGVMPPLLSAVQEVIPVDRQPDALTFLTAADPDEPSVLTVAERTYPGWGVIIDGQAAPLESVGGQLGVILPAGEATHLIQFMYRPPIFFIGAIITILTNLLTIGVLLRADRLRAIFPGKRIRTP